jgi:hypothetical protein
LRHALFHSFTLLQLLHPAPLPAGLPDFVVVSVTVLGVGARAREGPSRFM